MRLLLFLSALLSAMSGGMLSRPAGDARVTVAIAQVAHDGAVTPVAAVAAVRDPSSVVVVPVRARRLLPLAGAVIGTSPARRLIDAPRE